MKILFAASEAFPFCKTGGLADVAGSLPVSLAENGDQVAVILPLYDKIPYEWRQRMVYRSYIYVDVAWRHQYCGLFVMEYRGVTWYFVDNEHYFRRGRLYGEYDDGERFAFFCRAAAQLGKLGPSLRLRQNLQPTQLPGHAGFHLIGFHSVPPSSCFGYNFRRAYRKLL